MPAQLIRGCCKRGDKWDIPWYVHCAQTTPYIKIIWLLKLPCFNTRQVQIPEWELLFTLEKQIGFHFSGNYRVSFSREHPRFLLGLTNFRMTRVFQDNRIIYYLVLLFIIQVNREGLSSSAEHVHIKSPSNYLFPYKLCTVKTTLLIWRLKSPSQKCSNSQSFQSECDYLQKKKKKSSLVVVDFLLISFSSSVWLRTVEINAIKLQTYGCFIFP